MKLNNKGMSIIEVVLTFVLIMAIVTGLLTVMMNYRDKASLSLKKNDLDTLKNTLTKDIQDDILKLKVREMNLDGECKTISNLQNCVNIVFQDGTSKIFGTSKIDPNNRDSIENKYLYYDGEKYKLKDTLPSKIPNERNILDFQTITINDNSMLSIDTTVLDDGTVIDIYSIDVYISHSSFDEDFGIHIVATNDQITL